MKYSALKMNTSKTKHIKAFDGGIDLSVSPNFISDNSLSAAENMIFKNNTIKTRPGINSDISRIISCEYSEDAFGSDYKLSSEEFFIEEIPYRIFTEYIGYDESEYIICIYLIDSEGSTQNSGTIRFRRKTNELFYIPLHVTYYQGKPQNGGGIFALISLSNMENYTETYYEVYEINADYMGWSKANSYYIPTVYINGRGDSYETANAENFAFSEKPTVLEAPNMLNGEFYAYYSSDGYSSSFNLPFTGISDTSVICRINSSISSYTEWIIGEGQTKATEKFLGTNVTMNVDRARGLIYFTVEAGDFSVPLMEKCRANNIKIRATKDIEGAFDEVVSCRCAKSFNSRIILSGGKKNNTLYSARYDNPLYFPLTDMTEIGNKSTAIKVFSSYKDKLLAFSDNSVYAVSVKAGKRLNEVSVLPENDTFFYSGDSFSTSCISDTVGCAGENALTLYKGKPVWVGNDGYIYSLDSANRVRNISSKIKPLLDEENINFFKELFVSFSNSEYCMFAIENKVFVLNAPNGSFDEDKISWYFWNFPQEINILCGFYQNISPILFCRCNYSTCYTASLKGEKDVLIYMDEEFVKEERNINSSLSTKFFDFGNINLKKRLNKIVLRLNAKGKSKIKINEKTADTNLLSLNGNKKELKKVVILPEINIFDSVYITLESDSFIELGATDFDFTELKI